MLRKLKNLYHLFQAIVANLWFGFPARKLTVIGVTGTDGKTTTTSLIYHILKLSGKKTTMISTVGAYIGDHVSDIGFHVTNPASWPLQSYIKKAVDVGCKYLVLEVTSHGLDQNRVWGIPFTVGVLTNITHEHLDYHKTWEEYARTKFWLFELSRIVVMNMDDQSHSFYKENSEFRTSSLAKVSGDRQNSELKSKNLNSQIITYSLNNPQATYNLKKFPFTSKLIGEFNQANCLAAVAAAKAVGLNDDDIKKAISTFTAPTGRMETVYDKKFRVVIDFAHTPNAFAQVLPVVKKITPGRLIHVFGAAAERDESKRPLMGTESAKYADVIILTAEDPRGESVADICKQIANGFPPSIRGLPRRPDSVGTPRNDTQQYAVISDRRAAIKLAISLARPGDTVILTGKSHEKSMNYGHGEEPWDEFAVVNDSTSRQVSTADK